MATPSRFNQSACHSRCTPVAFSALTLLLIATVHAETSPAAPIRPLPPPLAAEASPQPQSKLRPTSPNIPFAGLSIQALDGVSLLSENQGRRSFSTLNPLDTPKIQAVFHLKNETDKPILLERLQPSCHCTMATVEGVPAGAALPTIAPGQTVAVRVTVDLAGHPAGNLEKSVSVYVPGQTPPAAVLIMQATLTSLVTITPPLLDFGTVPAGTTARQTLTVTADARLAPGGILPALRSSSPSLRLDPQPVAPPKTAALRSFTRAYTVTLSPDAALGPLSGVVRFDPLAGAKPDSAAAQAFTGASVLLLGQVQGEVSALPQTLAFGTVRLGEESIRQIGLTGTSAASVKSLSVVSASPWVSAHLGPLAPTFEAGGRLVDAGRTLQVTLSRQTPPGTVKTQLKVRLASGRALLIPVSAYVSDHAGF